MGKKLTEKQIKYCQEVAKGKSLVEAYRAAYDTKRMKESVIRVKASELQKNGNITVTIDEFKKKYSKAAVEADLIDAKKIISTYAKILNADLGTFFTPIGEDKKGNPIYAVKNFSEIDTAAVRKAKIDPSGRIYDIELYDKNVALAKLSDIFGLAESVRSQGDGVEVVIDDKFGDMTS